MFHALLFFVDQLVSQPVNQSVREPESSQSFKAKNKDRRHNVRRLPTGLIRTIKAYRTGLEKE